MAYFKTKKITSVDTDLPLSPLFELVLESITEGLIVADENGNSVLFNSAAEAILGSGPTGAVPIEWTAAYPTYLPDDDSLSKVEEFPLVTALNGKTVTNRHLRICRPDGSVRDLCCSAHPLVNEQGNKKGGFVVFRDISNEVQTNKKLEETVSALRMSNKDLEQFASVAAHDLQEPLRSVNNFLELFLEVVPVKDEQALHYVAKIRAAVKRMQALINALLNYARIESRARPFQSVDCSIVLASCLENLGSAIKAKGAKVSVGEMPMVIGDESQIGQLFENLISNAIKFSKEDPHVSVSAKVTGPLCEFRVSDNGIGIQPRFHDRIFLIFQRLHTAGKYEGTGIGLSICKRIVARHGGDIQVESEENKGCSFVFTLRRAEGNVQ